MAGNNIFRFCADTTSNHSKKRNKLDYGHKENTTLPGTHARFISEKDHMTKHLRKCVFSPFSAKNEITYLQFLGESLLLFKYTEHIHFRVFFEAVCQPWM